MRFVVLLALCLMARRLLALAVEPGSTKLRQLDPTTFPTHSLYGLAPYLNPRYYGANWNYAAYNPYPDAGPPPQMNARPSADGQYGNKGGIPPTFDKAFAYRLVLTPYGWACVIMGGPRPYWRPGSGEHDGDPDGGS